MIADVTLGPYLYGHMVPGATQNLSLKILQPDCLGGIWYNKDQNAGSYDFGSRWPLLKTAIVRVTSEQARPRSGYMRS